MTSRSGTNLKPEQIQEAQKKEETNHKAMHVRQRENSMQMTSPWLRCAVPILTVFIALSPVEAGSAKATLVEVWSGGDDGLTLRLRASLEEAFKSSSAFVLSSGKKPGTLIVTIPTNVPWKQVGQRTKVLYTVNFASIDNQPLGTSKGSCWDDALTKCANKIVKDATAVARKVHQH